MDGDNRTNYDWTKTNLKWATKKKMVTGWKVTAPSTRLDITKAEIITIVHPSTQCKTIMSSHETIYKAFLTIGCCENTPCHTCSHYHATNPTLLATTKPIEVKLAQIYEKSWEKILLSRALAPMSIINSKQNTLRSIFNHSKCTVCYIPVHMLSQSSPPGNINVGD